MDLYSYTGSFTYPDCEQNVNWFISSSPTEVSSTQLDYFQNQWEDNSAFANGEGNNRSTKSLGSRTVYVTGDTYDDFAAYLVAAFAVLFL
jgi:carbonic anhydrase